jgi:hypothetical protein
MATVIISIHGTVSYSAMFSKPKTVLITMGLGPYKESQILFAATHYYPMHVNTEDGTLFNHLRIYTFIFLFYFLYYFILVFLQTCNTFLWFLLINSHRISYLTHTLTFPPLSQHLLYMYLIAGNWKQYLSANLLYGLNYNKQKQRTNRLQ